MMKKLSGFLTLWPLLEKQAGFDLPFGVMSLMARCPEKAALSKQLDVEEGRKPVLFHYAGHATTELVFFVFFNDFSAFFLD